MWLILHPHWGLTTVVYVEGIGGAVIEGNVQGQLFYIATEQRWSFSRGEIPQQPFHSAEETPQPRTIFRAVKKGLHTSKLLIY